MSKQQEFCSVTDCGAKHLARGLCKQHYRKATAAGTLPPTIRRFNAGRTCSIDDCESPTISLGMCIKHYARQLKWGDPHRVRMKPTCTANDCHRPIQSKGFCSMHLWRWKQHGSPEIGARSVWPQTCTVGGCETPATHQGMCSKHRARLDRTGSTADPVFAGRAVTTGGYWIIKAEGHPVARIDGWALEHRVVLYDRIGPNQTQCHWCGTGIRWDHTYPQHLDGLVTDHLDGDKLNNDPSNLVPSCARCNLARSPRKRASA